MEEASRSSAEACVVELRRAQLQQKEALVMTSDDL
jgi:hypothetical protein